MAILSTLFYLALTFFLMGILIFVHELGHYLTARACKVTIHEFSLGMGKRLCGFTSKKTGIQYSLRLFPIGGYVSMAGEDEDKEGEENDPNAFNKKNVWQRLIILVAGAAMNVITGALAVNHYRLVTADGISEYFFVETKSYEWKQVTGYTVDCDNDNDGLSVTFTMRDGKQYEILQGVNSTTEAFDKTYTSVTHFAYDVDQRMTELQVPRNTRHMERAVTLYRDHPLWPYVSKLIGYVELVPQPDETAEVTEAPTEAPTEAETPSVSE